MTVGTRRNLQFQRAIEGTLVTRVDILRKQVVSDGRGGIVETWPPSGDWFLARIDQLAATAGLQVQAQVQGRSLSTLTYPLAVLPAPTTDPMPLPLVPGCISVPGVILTVVDRLQINGILYQIDALTPLGSEHPAHQATVWHTPRGVL